MQGWKRMVLEGREGDGRRSGLFGVWIDDIRHICLFGRFLRARTCTRTKHNKANNKSEMVGSEKERKSEGKGMGKGGEVVAVVVMEVTCLRCWAKKRTEDEKGRWRV